MTEKQLTLQKIQHIANVIDIVKGSATAKDIDGKAIYWLGRLRDYCTPVMKQIEDANTELIKKYTITDNGDGTRKINSEKYSIAYKKLVEEEKETIKMPEFKASQFFIGEKSMVPTEFWQIMTEHIEIDLDWMKE